MIKLMSCIVAMALISVSVYLLVLLVSSKRSSAYVIKEYPMITTALIGEDVQFTCILEEAVEQTTTFVYNWYVEWFEDSEDIRKIPAQMSMDISDVERPEFANRGVYSTTNFAGIVTPDLISHNFKLDIKGVTPRDNGYFGVTYQVNQGSVTRFLLADKVRLIVVEIPADNPICEYKLVDSASVALTCTSAGGIPSADLGWYDEDGLQQHETSIDDLTIQVPVDLTLTRTFQCRSQQGTLPPKTCEVVLDEESQQPNSISSENTTPRIPSTILLTTSPAINSQNITIIIIISAAVLVTIILAVCLLLLCFCCRKKKRRRDSEPPIDIQLPEVLSIDQPTEPVEENPYGNKPGASVAAAAAPVFEEDSEPDLKPWKNNPDYFMDLDNDGFSEDEFSEDADSATESYHGYADGGAAIYDTPCD